MVTTPSFQRLLIQELDDGCRALVIDLCGCEFLGSMGLAALVDGKQQAERTATALAVAGMNRIVGRALHATGLEPLFNTYPRATDAISALSQDDRNHLPDPRPS
jgi:anti-sigma B factor antagonist